MRLGCPVHLRASIDCTCGRRFCADASTGLCGFRIRVYHQDRAKEGLCCNEEQKHLWEKPIMLL